MPPNRPVHQLPTESLGPLLAQLRADQGWSQLRLAEQLCAASGVPTVSRHEVSRWEREERVPGPFWLRWLAAVLETPLDRLAAARLGARAAARPGSSGRPRLAGRARPAAPVGAPRAGRLARRAGGAASVGA
jgi:transcriptional regulator with XRE-family HTH domain